MEQPKQQIPIDESPSGRVEHLFGLDGKLRAYIRLVDHNIVINNVLAVMPQPPAQVVQ